MRAAARAGAHQLGRVVQLLHRIGDTQNTVMRKPGMDLAGDVDELYYADQYTHWLAPLLDDQKTVIDVGCGAGRLTGPVARALPDAKIVGIDISPGKLSYARTHLAGLSNVSLVQADCVNYLSTVAQGSVDLVLFTEVDFFNRDSQMLAAIARVLRPSGLLFAAFRSEWFNLAHSVKQRDFASAETVRDARSGELWGTPYRFQWGRTEEIKSDLAGLGFSVENCYGIGVLSGREGDALDVIARPETLTDAERAALLELELSLAERYADCGRYILMVARKN